MLSWAITIHKVQGLTLDAVVVDMAKSKGDYQCGQAYVAFSCVKQLIGLHIVKYTREQVKSDQCINQFMETNRSQQIPQLHPALTQNPYTGVTVVHQNIQGLSPHRKLMDEHATLTTAHVICMSETHLKNHSPWPLKSIATLNFYIEQNERTLLAGGGIAVCIQKSLGPIEKN